MDSALNSFHFEDYHKAIDALITNFHLPKSTLVMLVSAFSSRANVLHAYEHAVKENYRFFSFGDAMFITGEKMRDWREASKRLLSETNGV